MVITTMAGVIILLSEIEWWHGVCLQFGEIARTALVSHEWMTLVDTG